MRTLRPGPDLLAGAPSGALGTLRVLMPLTALVTDHDAMTATLASGRASTTPAEPLLLNARADLRGRYEVADGHHRIADALRAGRTHLWADVDPIPDCDPYEGPFYDFSLNVRKDIS